MPDIADDRAAYAEAMRRAEEAAGITRDASGNEVYADEETPVATPELQDAVPVSASDQPLNPVEPAAEADTSEEQQEQVEETPVAELTIEQAQVEIARLTERLEAKDSMIGRQSTEVGELRTRLEQLERFAAQAQPAPQAPQMAITQDMIDADPGRAVQIAFAQKNDQVLEIAFNAWKDEDPFAAASWRADRLLERQQEAFEARLKETQQQIQAATAPLAKSAENAEWSEAFVEMQRQYPDFLKVDESTGKTQAQSLLEEVAPQFPAVAKLIAEGDAATKVQGLKLLYGEARLGSPEQIAAELQKAADDAAAETAATRAAAGVVATQATVGQGSAVELTEEQQEVEAYKSRMTGKPSLARGWTGRA